MNDILSNEFKKNVYLKPDEYLNGWAKKCGWKATLVYDSLWRHADKEKRCFPSIELMAEEHGVGYNTIRRGLKTLIEYNLISVIKIRNEKGKFLNNTYILNDKSKWKSPQPHQGDGRSIALSGKDHSPVGAIKDTHIKDTHTNKYSSLKDISELDLVEISEKYKVSLGFVKLQFEKLQNYCEARGRVYKNYKSALRNFVLGDMQKQVERRQDDTKRGVDLSHLK